ncbi:LLM class flavin-dependent oxidoreductase [Thalassobaculum sp. OXR-137]|uniref:LLM class flavin-dependent oxidoreductase n=1 Tax=Thalassobaculum sp. OXR-137 TaxID=3100173 RepID=UPI002AC9A186|nr:LLM class flavin-dependent oxidoreductase [Thalassobaculum sp. OXR-137]WPZ33366.1 LLM class flavin-dependent oxidoreductase [Thalassobaculum sp. OXR-137]
MPLISVLDQSPIRAGATPGDAVAETIELARLADRLGFHRYWVAEHHSSEGLAGSVPEILITRLANETSRIRVGSGGVMLPHYAPLKVAETFRMLETMYPGRIDLGIGRAPGSDQRTARALSYVRDPIPIEYFPRQVQDLMDWMDGKLEDDHPFRGVTAQPAGPTSPPVWLLGSSDQGAQAAAHFGTAFSFAHFITEGGEPVVEMYKKRFQPSSTLADPQANIGVFVICAETEEEAKYHAASRDLWRVRLDQGHITPIPTPEEALNYEFTESERQRAAFHRRRNIVGTPDQVREKLDAVLARYGVDEAVVVTITHDHKARMKSYELLAKAYDLSPMAEAAE